MARNISFALTTPQFLDGSKDVTRRMGWKNLSCGDTLCAVEKSQGLKKGETIKRLGNIRVVSVRRERLDEMTQRRSYGIKECKREGLAEMDPEDFVAFFCATHKGCTSESLVTRIEFERVPATHTEGGTL